MQFNIAFFKHHRLAKQYTLWCKLDKTVVVILLPGEQLPLAQAEITRVDALLFSKLSLR
jgi:hypothetical protein